MHDELRELVNGLDEGFPYVPAETHVTERGTYYLRGPGTHLIAKPNVSLHNLSGFLDGFAPELQFAQYIDDPTTLPAGTQLCKVAGQLCYMSFGPKRTSNENAKRYFDNIKSSGHGSVLEHANFSFLFYGLSRSVTHELVRHRAGFGYSMLSQRYVSGRVLRFVERPEYVDDPELHALFCARIDRAAAEYEEMAEALLRKQKEGAD